MEHQYLLPPSTIDRVAHNFWKFALVVSKRTGTDRMAYQFWKLALVSKITEFLFLLGLLFANKSLAQEVRRNSDISDRMVEGGTDSKRIAGCPPNIRRINECCLQRLCYTSTSIFLPFPHASFSICVQMWTWLQPHHCLHPCTKTLNPVLGKTQCKLFVISALDCQQPIWYCVRHQRR